MEVIDYVRAAMWIIGAVTSLTAIAVGIILAHHWRSYSMEQGHARIALAAYALVSLLLIIGMFAMTPAF
jgi:hypothetical protein